MRKKLSWNSDFEFGLEGFRKVGTAGKRFLRENLGKDLETGGHGQFMDRAQSQRSPWYMGRHNRVHWQFPPLNLSLILTAPKTNWCFMRCFQNLITTKCKAQVCSISLSSLDGANKGLWFTVAGPKEKFSWCLEKPAGEFYSALTLGFGWDSSVNTETAACRSENPEGIAWSLLSGSEVDFKTLTYVRLLGSKWVINL